MENKSIEFIKSMIDAQQKKGLVKYGRPVSPQRLDTYSWLGHLQEEMIDALVYAQMVKERIEQSGNVDFEYAKLVRHILENGVERNDRTGTGTISIFNYNFEVDMSKGFPLLTTKRVYWKGIATETIMFLKGITDLKYLLDRGVDIWTRDAYRQYLRHCEQLGETTPGLVPFTLEEFREDAKINGYDLGPIYGAQWRDFNGDGIDQLREVVQGVVHDPDSRRLKVYSSNPSEAQDMALPPCHDSWQLYVRNEYLDLKFSMRSTDVGAGLPFNLGSYGLILSIICRITGKIPGKLIFDGGDVHIYKNHIEALTEQIEREPRELPTLLLAELKFTEDVFDRLEPDKFTLDLVNYNPHPPVKIVQSY